ncbi:hypothetical protein BVRB_2g035050 isoform A [Beta vulgaris subsp. vulgaris]|nr:hypothetical protein BVRB_2g035050 isoform A [Beta vulgaris subsp. vulgaris]
MRNLVNDLQGEKLSVSKLQWQSLMLMWQLISMFKRSLLCIETADRSGLLMEVIKIMADINVDVESAEIDTEGLVAKDKFHVSYRGAALNTSLSQGGVACCTCCKLSPTIVYEEL